MGSRLAEKVAVVTGAGSGMGRAMAETFVREGACVLCADFSGQQDAVAEELGETAIAMKVDVRHAEEVQAMIAMAEEKFGRVDIVCNNAGVSGGGGCPLHETPDEAIDSLIDVNFKGVLYGIRYAAISMLKSGGGSIINTASASAIVGWKGLSVYAGTKGGVVQMSKSAALDYAENNIRVNAICPGMTWTGMALANDGSRLPPAGEQLPAEVPMNRWGLDTDIANAALFLASDESSYITGMVMPVDGGYVVP